jgi:hypothetical protein
MDNNTRLRDQVSHLEHDVGEMGELLLRVTGDYDILKEKELSHKNLIDELTMQLSMAHESQHHHSEAYLGGGSAGFFIADEDGEMKSRSRSLGMEIFDSAYVSDEIEVCYHSHSMFFHGSKTNFFGGCRV